MENTIEDSDSASDQSSEVQPKLQPELQPETDITHDVENTKPKPSERALVKAPSLLKISQVEINTLKNEILTVGMQVSSYIHIYACYTYNIAI